VVVPPLYKEQQCASLWLFDPGRGSWRRAALEGSVLAVSPDGARAVTTPWWFGGELGGRPTETTQRPASERGVLHLVDLASGETRGTFSLPGAGRWMPPAGREVFYFLADAVLVMNDLGSDPLHTLEGRYPETVSAVISPDGTLMAAWSWDNIIELWDLANGRVAGRLAGHGDGILAAAVAPDGGRVASSSWDRTLRVWDLAQAGTAATVATDPVVTSVVFNPDGRRLAWGDRDGRVFVGEAANPAAAESSAAHRGAVSSLALSPDGAVLASGGMEGEVWLWRTEPLQPLGVLGGHAGPVTALAFGADGRTVVAGSETGDLLLFRADQAPIQSFGSGSSGDLNLLTAGDEAVGITLSSRREVERPGVMVRALDAASGREAWHIPLQLPSYVVPFASGGLFFTPRPTELEEALARRQSGEPSVAIPASVIAALSADGRWLALAIAAELQLWDVPAATLAGSIPFRRTRSAVAFRPDGGALLIAGGDGVAHVLSMRDGQWTLTRDLGALATGVAWSPDGHRAALLLPFDQKVMILDAEAGQPSLEITYPEGPAPLTKGFDEFVAPAFSPDGTRLAAPVPGHAIALWDAATGERLATFTGHAHEATSVAFSPDGARLVAGAVDGSVLVWDAATGDLLLRLAGEGRDRLEPAVVRYSVAAELDPASPVGPGAVLRPLTGRTFGPDDAEQAAVAAVGFSPDGSSVWATLADGTVRIWNALEDPGRTP
jgi:WD40 repeat protein